jgi:toxin YhaV
MNCDNGWNIYFFKLFKAIIDDLILNVKALKTKDPENFKSSRKYKLLKSIYKCITEYVPANPNSREFLLRGNLSNWRRVKKNLPRRYRMFFRFTSSPQDLFFVWINDPSTYRKAGAKTDCYKTFLKKTGQENIQSCPKILKKDSSLMENSDFNVVN